jgi:hypothetical protein
MGPPESKGSGQIVLVGARIQPTGTTWRSAAHVAGRGWPTSTKFHANSSPRPTRRRLCTYCLPPPRAPRCPRWRRPAAGCDIVTSNCGSDARTLSDPRGERSPPTCAASPWSRTAEATLTAVARCRKARKCCSTWSTPPAGRVDRATNTPRPRTPRLRGVCRIAGSAVGWEGQRVRDLE